MRNRILKGPQPDHLEVYVVASRRASAIREPGMIQYWTLGKSTSLKENKALMMIPGGWQLTGWFGGKKNGQQAGSMQVASDTCNRQILEWGRRIWICVLTGLLLTAHVLFSASTVEAQSVAVGAKLKAEAETTAFELTLSEGVTAEVFTLANPYRVIIDLPDVAFKLPAGTGQAGDGLITAFRYGLFAERKARVVIDTKGPVKIAGAEMTSAGVNGAVMLKVSLMPTDAASFGAGTGSERHAMPPAAAAIEEPADKPKMARLKPIIVIDPGHGGIDPGAMGNGMITEKSLVLAVSQQLQAALQASGRYDVRMTRTTDVFVSLDKRLKFSRDNDADLFISLHADSIEERSLAQAIRGATVYTLSERASDDQARLMAEKENASDLIAGLEFATSDGGDQVKNILIDLMKRETSNFSADFAKELVQRLGKSIALSKDPQRSAAFKVLKQTHAPSVLIELGYISNAQDEQSMSSQKWQKQVAGSIAAAVNTYFTKRTAEHP